MNLARQLEPIIFSIFSAAINQLPENTEKDALTRDYETGLYRSHNREGDCIDEPSQIAQ